RGQTRISSSRGSMRLILSSLLGSSAMAPSSSLQRRTRAAGPRRQLHLGQRDQRLRARLERGGLEQRLLLLRLVGTGNGKHIHEHFARGLGDRRPVGALLARLQVGLERGEKALAVHVVLAAAGDEITREALEVDGADAIGLGARRL